MSATPAPYELELTGGRFTRQVIRPTGLMDPPVTVRPTKGQIDDLLTEIKDTVQAGGRILVTTLTKRMSESLADYLAEQGVKVKYLHCDIDTMERVSIINSLRRGDYDVVVGINLLREGLDIPEVRLVAILDADKEGFLRSETSLIQTIGRAARNSESRVIMYGDVITNSMRKAMDETAARRELQMRYNAEHGITPQTIIKPIKNTIEITSKQRTVELKDIGKELDRLRSLMNTASRDLDFESAIMYRDKIAELRDLQRDMAKKNNARKRNDK